MEAQDAKSNQLVAIVGKVAEGIVQLQEQQKAIAVTLSQLGTHQPPETDTLKVAGKHAAADTEPGTV
jgi:ABC-type hemin transport system substrate-binding protein